MKHTIYQGLQAMLRHLSLLLLMLLMAVAKLLPLPRSLELYPALLQEKTMHQFGP
jgi:hypothetical protein